MLKAPIESPVVSVKLDQILKTAIILAWKDLGQSPTDGRVQVEYHVAGDGSLESLKMWCANSRGFWSLVCDYLVTSGGWGGPRFANGYHSRELGRMLEAITMNQSMFLQISPPGSNVLVEVKAPGPEQVADAQQLAATWLQPATPTIKVKRQTPRVPIAVSAPAAP